MIKYVIVNTVTVTNFQFMHGLQTSQTQAGIEWA